MTIESLRCRRFGSSDRRNPRISEIDGERFLRDEVDAVRDEWAERKDTVPFCSKSNGRGKNEPLQPHPRGFRGGVRVVRSWLVGGRTDTYDESRTGGKEQTR